MTNKLIQIISYQPQYKVEVNQLINEIKEEFDLPISNKSYGLKEPDFYCVAQVEKKIVGTVAINYENGFAVLKRMFVLKEMRGKIIGVSQLLMNKVLKNCIENNFDTIYLGTMEEFKAAHKFYEKNNFVKILKEDLPNEFINNPIDSVFYRLRINKDDIKHW